MKLIPFIFIAVGFLALPIITSATAPPLRNEINLNSSWLFRSGGLDLNNETGFNPITVPDAWDGSPGYNTTTTKEGTYKTTITIPSVWTGNKVFLEFEGINHIADVYLNNQYIAGHIGGWTPFRADISGYVSPANSYTVKVHVKGGSFQPIVDNSNCPQYPVGWYGQSRQWGIIFDVFLRNYGEIYLKDTFIKTSVVQKQLTIGYSLVNTTNQTRNIQITYIAEKNGTVELTGQSGIITLAPAETKAVTVTQAWPNPAIWTPAFPNLYLLKSEVHEGSEIIDAETRRFGFREITISGNQYYLNGVRLNLWGDSMNIHAQGFNGNGYVYVSKNTWPGTVDKILAKNIRILRAHQQPAAPFVLDTADEKGLLYIDESPMYARTYLCAPATSYVTNALSWIPAWVISRRNHPALILWSAENELGPGTGYINYLTNSQILSLGNKIREFDNTRPVIYDGDKEVGDQTYNQHYPEGYNAAWSGSIYKMTQNLSKPYGIGEFLTDYGPSLNKWWQGLATRGLRYKNFNDIRPYTLFWVWNMSSAEAQAINIRNSFSPVALFDKAYDDMGAAAISSNAYPSLSEGTRQNRTLILYNDEFENTSLTVELFIKIGAEIYASGIQTGTLNLGSHQDIPISFQVPYRENSVMSLVLRVIKNGNLKFEEIRNFNIIDEGTSGNSDNNINISWSPEITPSPTPIPTLAPTIYPTSTPIPLLAGDADGNGFINIEDILIVLNKYAKIAGLPSDQYQDGIINSLDFGIVVKNFPD